MTASTLHSAASTLPACKTFGLLKVCSINSLLELPLEHLSMVNHVATSNTTTAKWHCASSLLCRSRRYASAHHGTVEIHDDSSSYTVPHAAMGTPAYALAVTITSEFGTVAIPRSYMQAIKSALVCTCGVLARGD